MLELRAQRFLVAIYVRIKGKEATEQTRVFGYSGRAGS